jgi:uncharacterized membrane protein YidH (DUF202 family)
MKKIGYLVGSLATLAMPFAASAQIADSASAGEFGTLLTNILTFTNTVLIPFIIGIGFLVFVFGMFQYFIAGGANEEKKEAGKSLMIYATLGFVLIIVFWGVVNLLTESTGLDGESVLNTPTVVVPVP